MLNTNTANQIAQTFLYNQGGYVVPYLIDFAAFESTILNSTPIEGIQNKYINANMHQQY